MPQKQQKPAKPRLVLTIVAFSALEESRESESAKSCVNDKASLIKRFG